MGRQIIKPSLNTIVKLTYWGFNMKVVINGRVLLKPLNGIPRFAYEVIAELDKLFKKGEAVLIMPENDIFNCQYRNIEVIKTGKNNSFWDFKVSEKYAKKNKALYINLASGACHIKDSVVCIHDIRPLTWGDGKKTLKSIKNKFKIKYINHTVIKNVKVILTVSEFEKQEIINYYKMKNTKRVRVVGNGWGHLLRINVDKELDEKLKDEEYCFSISSVAPHKNFPWVLQVAKNNINKKFYIAGRVDLSLWGDEILTDMPRNVEYLGYISDEEMKTYLQNAEALLFPSFYEGFGVPPLEALALNVPAVVSDIPVMHEIFGESVHYIDPYDANVNLDEILSQPVITPTSVLDKYTWQNSAKAIYNILKEM